jgi:hypothetical protein
VEVRPVSLKLSRPNSPLGGEQKSLAVPYKELCDNCISVQGRFLPLRCRADSITSGVATAHQSPKRGSMGGTRNPTAHPPEQSGLWRGRRIHGCLVVRRGQPPRSIGCGQQARRGAARGSHRRRAPPQHPAQRGILSATPHGGAERGPPVSLLRRNTLPARAGVNRRRRGGRSAQEAKAPGKARGYADVRPDVWDGEGGGGVQQGGTRPTDRCLHGSPVAGRASSAWAVRAKSVAPAPHHVVTIDKSADAKSC